MNKVIEISGKKIAYSVQGKGVSLVFLHGFLGNRSVWDAFVNHFKKQFNVITIDLPGHGETSIFGEEISTDFSAKLVEKVLQKEGVKSCHLVGHSMGGYVALAYAKLFTKNVKSLTLFNSSARGDSEEKKADRLKAIRIFDMNPSIFIDEAIKNLFFEPNLAKFPKKVKKLTEMAKKTAIEGAKASLKGIKNREDLLNWLACRTFPVLYIAGKNDNTISYSSILEQVNETEAQLITLKNSGHMGFVEDENVCIEAIEKFICQNGIL